MKEGKFLRIILLDDMLEGLTIIASGLRIALRNIEVTNINSNGFSEDPDSNSPATLVSIHKVRISGDEHREERCSENNEFGLPKEIDVNYIEQDIFSKINRKSRVPIIFISDLNIGRFQSNINGAFFCEWAKKVWGELVTCWIVTAYSTDSMSRELIRAFDSRRDILQSMWSKEGENDSDTNNIWSGDNKKLMKELGEQFANSRRMWSERHPKEAIELAEKIDTMKIDELRLDDEPLSDKAYGELADFKFREIFPELLQGNWSSDNTLKIHILESIKLNPGKWLTDLFGSGPIKLLTHAIAQDFKEEEFNYIKYEAISALDEIDKKLNTLDPNLSNHVFNGLKEYFEKTEQEYYEKLKFSGNFRMEIMSDIKKLGSRNNDKLPWHNCYKLNISHIYDALRSISAKSIENQPSIEHRFPGLISNNVDEACLYWPWPTIHEDTIIHMFDWSFKNNKPHIEYIYFYSETEKKLKYNHETQAIAFVYDDSFDDNTFLKDIGPDWVSSLRKKKLNLFSRIYFLKHSCGGLDIYALSPISINEEQFHSLGGNDFCDKGFLASMAKDLRKKVKNLKYDKTWDAKSILVFIFDSIDQKATQAREQVLEGDA